MKNLSFTPVTLDGRSEFYELWHKTPRRSLDYSLPNIWGWQQYFGLQWAFDGDLCWLRQTVPFVTYWAPVGDWDAVDWAASGIDACRSFIRVPEELLERWRAALPDKVEEHDSRGQWEYLYLQSDLATLPGNRYHKKRNHLRGIEKAYGIDYRPLDDAMVEDVLGLQDDWCQWHECEDSPSLRAENEAINRVLSHWELLDGLCGGSLYVDGQMVAFSVGEALDEKTLGVHYEKGLNGFRGVYQTINACFSREAGNGFELLNRAQDLDEEGLRQAKMTYLPTDFLRKYQVSFK